mmetsp:Transcript_4293/g.8472  ORF Transcript_4293/g.8472 Transcript_4293/m.8472 type:complete len:94 (-) Transcript_4293:34-315(-)
MRKDPLDIHLTKSLSLIYFSSLLIKIHSKTRITTATRPRFRDSPTPVTHRGNPVPKSRILYPQSAYPFLAVLRCVFTDQHLDPEQMGTCHSVC